jgi:F-type H+-transporting ATPase subunit gamma
MAGGQERILRRRISSVQSTKKITRAMELIAASRIVRAQARVRAAMPYAETITEVVHELADRGAGAGNPLLNARPEIRRVGLVVVAADRGLCGGYNAFVHRAAEATVREHTRAGREYGLVVVGRKVESYFRFRGYTIDAALTGFSEQPTYEDARAVAAKALGPFLDTAPNDDDPPRPTYDQVELIYTRFVSAGNQEVVVRALIPVEPDPPAPEAEAQHHEAGPSYDFEPSPEVILERLLPRYVEARVFAALLNASASEHAARQRAMKAATDNADELITSLTRVMNRARQDSITTEIMEIVSGAEALRQTPVEPEADRFLVPD